MSMLSYLLVPKDFSKFSALWSTSMLVSTASSFPAISQKLLALAYQYQVRSCNARSCHSSLYLLSRLPAKLGNLQAWESASLGICWEQPRVDDFTAYCLELAPLTLFTTVFFAVIAFLNVYKSFLRAEVRARVYKPVRGACAETWTGLKWRMLFLATTRLISWHSSFKMTIYKYNKMTIYKMTIYKYNNV